MTARTGAETCRHTGGQICPRCSWARPRDAVLLVVRGRTAAKALPVAAVVGTVLSLVNQGSVIANGASTPGTWVRVAVNYVVPFLVANIGYLSGRRVRTPAGPLQRTVEVGDQLPPVTLYDANGESVELAELLDRPMVVPLVRCYGCMPCRAFLYELNDVRDELDAVGVGIIAVGGAADYQAQHLMEHGIGFPLLLDPTHRLYTALDVRQAPWWALLKPVTWWKYLRAARRGRQGRITNHPLQAPGFAIVDSDSSVRFLHWGETLGDYPPIARIIEAAQDVGRR